MTRDEDFKLFKIQTCVLKVNVHCDGCRHKVKKLLQRIEGVFQVIIDSEQQKVAVSGSVDSATLIKKLIRAGKHAELWSPKSTQNHKQKNNYTKVENNNNKVQKQPMAKGLEAFKNQRKLSSLSFEEDEDYSDNDDDEEEEEDEGFRLIREKANKLNLLKQHGLDANKGGLAMANPGNEMKANNNGGIGSAGQKMNQNQNMGIKAGHGGIDQRTITGLKMNNANLGEAKKLNDLSTMMNLAGFHGNAPNIGSGLGHKSNNLGGFHPQSNNLFQNPSTADNNYTCGQYPSSLMNMNRNQPQMMYHRTPLILPTTGYYYNPNTYFETTGNSGDSSAAYMFSDENSSGCSIM